MRRCVYINNKRCGVLHSVSLGTGLTPTHALVFTIQDQQDVAALWYDANLVVTFLWGGILHEFSSMSKVDVMFDDDGVPTLTCTAAEHTVTALPVTVQVTAPGGTVIEKGDVLVTMGTADSFTCTTQQVCVDGAVVSVQPADGNNVPQPPAGTMCEWKTPRPGCAPQCVVV